MIELAEASALGRQPILDQHLQVFGYELLYRAGQKNLAEFSDANVAAVDVIVNSCLDWGLDRIVGTRLAFVNASRAVLVEGFAQQLPRDRVIVEVLETVPADDEVLGALNDLVRNGYQVALDDFVYTGETAPLLPYASFVKVDVAALSGPALEAQLEILRPAGVRLVAERVETQEDFQRCLRLGFHYFQGYFFARPAMIRGRRLRSDQLTVLRVLALLDDSHTSMAALEDAISCDVTLTYRLLKAVNSAYYGFESRIESLRHALVLLGHDRLRGWVSMAALSGLSQRPRELATLALQRAKMCEIIARGISSAGAPPSSYFTVGLLSILDALFEMPLTELVASLPLSPGVASALLERKGRMGEVLSAVVAYEQCRWDDVSGPGITLGIMADAFFEAVSWTGELDSSIAGAPRAA